MNHQKMVLSLSLLFLISGPVYADSVSSSIVCDGASWVASSVTGSEQTFSQNLFTTDPARIMRNLLVGKSIQTETRVESSGPLGIEEYSSQMKNQTKIPRVCLFDYPKSTMPGYHETRVLGLLGNGEYSASQSLTDTTRFLVAINGSGILMTRALSSDDNQTVHHASDVAGTMNVTEMMELGSTHAG